MPVIPDHKGKIKTSHWRNCQVDNKAVKCTEIGLDNCIMTVSKLVAMNCLIICLPVPLWHNQERVCVIMIRTNLIKLQSNTTPFMKIHLKNYSVSAFELTWFILKVVSVIFLTAIEIHRVDKWIETRMMNTISAECPRSKVVCWGCSLHHHNLFLMCTPHWISTSHLSMCNSEGEEQTYIFWRVPSMAKAFLLGLLENYWMGSNRISWEDGKRTRGANQSLVWLQGVDPESLI